jgi:Xaa-Pro aminopeptidase
MRRYRLEPVRAQMAEREIGACVLFDPVNIRYATGSDNMQVYHLGNPSRYLLLPVDGPVVLFEFERRMHLAAGLETIDEARAFRDPGALRREPLLRVGARLWHDRRVPRSAPADGLRGRRL